MEFLWADEDKEKHEYMELKASTRRGASSKTCSSTECHTRAHPHATDLREVLGEPHKEIPWESSVGWINSSELISAPRFSCDTREEQRERNPAKTHNTDILKHSRTHPRGTDLRELLGELHGVNALGEFLEVDYDGSRHTSASKFSATVVV